MFGNDLERVRIFQRAGWKLVYAKQNAGHAIVKCTTPWGSITMKGRPEQTLEDVLAVATYKASQEPNHIPDDL